MRAKEFNDFAMKAFEVNLLNENDKDSLPETEEELKLHMQLKL